MALDSRAVVIGLTAPFGSGSTTSAGLLASRLQFTPVKLSSFIKEDFSRGGNTEPTRADLQTHGDVMRKAAHRGILAQLATEKLATEEAIHSRIVIDGIRNASEIEYFRDVFGNRFYLFALESSASDRWERLRPMYEQNGETIETFRRDNLRDQSEDIEHGQQVQRCVDQADVLIDNGDDVTQAQLRDKLTNYAQLVLGLLYRFATPLETYMNIAYSAAHGIKVFKAPSGRRFG